MDLNHPETIPPTPSHGKIVFHETGPWCQKGWGPLLYAILSICGISGCHFYTLLGSGLNFSVCLSLLQ